MSSAAAKFERKINLFSGICFVTGTIIGSGIFISPKGVFVHADCNYNIAVLVWLACGFYSMLGALIYSELGTTIARSGGDYAYIKAGFGSCVSFLYLWLNVVVIRPASQAILALTFAFYLIGPFKPHCHMWDLQSRSIAALLIVFLGFVNCVNIKWAIRVQNLFTVLKLLALCSIVVLGIGTYLFDKLTNDLNAARKETMANWPSNGGQWQTQCDSNYSLAIYSGLFAFGGWNYLNIVTDELKEPHKNLPRAAMIGILIGTVIYVLANVAYFVILTPVEILISPTIALTFAQKLVGSFGTILMSLAISASAVGSLNGTLFTTSRLFCIAAHEAHLPAVMGMLHHQRRTPIVSLIFSVLVSLWMLLAKDIYSLINYFSFTYWLWTGIAVAAGLHLRHTHPQMERPIKLPLSLLLLFVALCFILTAWAVINDPINSAIGITLTLFGLPVYLLQRYTEKNQTTWHQWDLVCICIQRLLLVVETDDTE